MSKSNGKSNVQRGGRDWEWETEDFLDAFIETCSVTKACEKLGIGRTSAYRRRQKDEAFAVAWHDADEAIADALEAEAYRRAVNGVEKPIYQGGKKVGSVTQFSDKLLELMLKARRPEKYRDRVEVSGSLDVKRKVAQKSDEELDESLGEIA